MEILKFILVRGMKDSENILGTTGHEAGIYPRCQSMVGHLAHKFTQRLVNSSTYIFGHWEENGRGGRNNVLIKKKAAL